MGYITYANAKKYLDKGMSVFPVYLSKDDKGKIQKRPAIAWKQYITRLPTDEELQRWFGEHAENRYNGIGMATGKVSGLNVLDIEGYASEEVIKKFDSPLATKTISDGKHLFYKWTHDIHNSVKIEGEAVDFRGDGGFVVLPPSNIDGKSYSWSTQKADFSLLKPLPKEIEESLVVEKNESFGDLIINTGDLFPQALPGQRNMVAAQVAGSMARQVPPKLWEICGWPGFLVWNRNNPEPLDEEELRTTWDSITSTEMRKGSEEVNSYVIYEGKNAVREHDRLLEDFGGGITTGYKELDEFFKFMPQQLYLFAAPTHVGKTTFTLNIATRIAELGYRVIFASLEQGVFIAPRAEGMITGKEYPDDLHILTSNKMTTSAGIIEKVNSLTRKPDIVFIDHLHFMKKVGNNVTEGIDNMIIELQNMAKELNIPVVVIAHMRKLNENRRPTMDDLRDSSSLQQVPSVVVLLHREILPTEAMEKEGSYLDPYTDVIISKNRIQGKTGGMNFKFEKSGMARFVDKLEMDNHKMEIGNYTVVQKKKDPKDVGKDDFEQKEWRPDKFKNMKLPKPAYLD